ncbi:hypothetical protein ACFV9E_19685 [Streptomyces sp. NPDC059835]|uniref:hypothetical protein n=1 Tax=Streptomyces sp. NPDC059835 TaxID=3346967 RepID=UPI0036579181
MDLDNGTGQFEQVLQRGGKDAYVLGLDQGAGFMGRKHWGVGDGISGRGRSRRNRAVVAALAGAVLVATAVFAFTRGGEEPASQAGFCWESLAEDDVAALSPKPFKRYESQEDDLKNRPSATCRVYGDDRKYAEFYLRFGGVDEGMGVWRTADEVAAESVVRAPIDGVPGWANRTYAGVLLPASCARGAAIRGWPYLQINVGDHQGDVWKDGLVQKRMTDVLMTSAAHLTARLGCAEIPFGSPGESPKLLTARPTDRAKACGLPGFDPLTSDDFGIEEYVTQGDLRLWSCAISAKGEKGLRNLTATQDPTMIAVSRSKGAASGGNEALVTCAGKPTLLQLDTPFTDTAKNSAAAKALRPDAEIFAAFRDAVSGQAHCQ